MTISILFIFYINQILKIAALTTYQYSQLDPLKFDLERIWLVDTINTNDNYQFYNIFFFKNFAYCLKIHTYRKDVQNPPWIHLVLFLKSSGRWIVDYYGSVDGKVLNVKLLSEFKTDPDCNKRLEFVYTDYINVIVLLAGDSYSGPHIMVLRSSDTNMTYEQRMALIQPKVRLDFKTLKRVKPEDCIAMEKLSKFNETTFPNCKEFDANMKRITISDMVRKSLLLTIVVSGLLCIITNGVCWFVKRRNRAVVAPA